MIKVKICGLTRPCDIDAVNEEKPDYIGFVFADGRRKVSPRQAMDLRKKLYPGIMAAGVFVDEKIEHIISLAQNGIIDVIQLHGSENEQYIEKLKELTNKPIIKAIPVQKEDNIKKWSSTAADYLLLDSKGGGTGRTFDWNLIGETNKPYFLAGGLDINNITEAITAVKPFAADVSSGVETDGVKDPVKIKEFIGRVRNV